MEQQALQDKYRSVAVHCWGCGPTNYFSQVE